VIKEDLLRYWPREEDVAACVKTDAEAAHNAVLLAVHQPMQFERRLVGGEPGSSDACDEHELLRKFLAENLPDGRVILPIVGRSGIGKSHVIRWLDAQLRRSPGHDRRVIIRIPKGMSLKGVLGLLLKDLSHPVYDRFRQELIRAQEELDPEEAAGLLCEMLAHTVSEMGHEAHKRLQQTPGDPAAQERAALCRAEALPSLLRNQLLRDQHFVRTRDGRPGAVKRLVEQLTETRDASSEDDRQHSFTANDLVFDDVDRAVLGRMEARALAQIDRPERRTAAARLLNEALDGAKQRLLRLDPTVSELFDAIREQLLTDGRELVLLVEDFAVLSGLQKQLLQVIIKEAFRDGRQVLCTMRTALAYTDGYMDTATVLTRANVEYYISDTPGDDEDIHARIAGLVAAYLNAARLGQAAVDAAYRGDTSTTTDINSWIPVFRTDVEPEARMTLESFGAVGHYDLFPFNHDAIRELSREGSVQGNRLVYNPRFVIQNVINKVLDHRDAFMAGEFPPASFGSQSRPVSPKVTEEIRRRVPPAQYERYLRFVAYWGGFPSMPGDLGAIAPRLFRAFGLDELPFAGGKGSATPASPPRPPEEAQPPARPQPDADRHPLEVKWEGILDAWRAKTPIAQADALQLRKWVADALKAYIDWDWDLFRPRKDEGVDAWKELIFIPFAAGQYGRTADASMASICAESDLDDQAKSARLHSALMAVVRFHGVHEGWHYANADEDMPKYAALVSAMAGRARRFVKGRYFRAEWDPVPALVEGLLIGARALGLETPAKERDHASLIEALFAPTDGSLSPDGAGGDVTGWTDFTNALRRCRGTGDKEARDQLSWQGHLLALVGARQGQAELIHAVDVFRLKPAIEAVTETWEFRQSLPNQPGVPDYAPFRTAYADLKKLAGSVDKAQKRLTQWRDDTRAWLGENADKTAIVREAKEAIEGARATGLTVGQDTKTVVQLLDKFDDAKIMATLNEAGRLGSGVSRGTALVVLGRSSEEIVSLCDDLRRALGGLLQHIEAELANEEIKYGPDPLSEAVSDLTYELTATNQTLSTLEAL
jgi:hypothetical protein